MNRLLINIGIFAFWISCAVGTTYAVYYFAAAAAAGGSAPTFQTLTTKEIGSTPNPFTNVVHSVSAGANPCLFVACIVDVAGNANASVTNTTTGAGELTIVGTATAGSAVRYVRVFQDVGPASGNNSIDVTWSGAGTSVGTIYVWDYINVNQTTATDGVLTGNAGGATSWTESVTSATDDLVVGLWGVNAANTVTGDNSETERANDNPGGGSGVITGLWERPGAGSVTIGGSWGSSADTGHVAFNVNQP